MLKFDQFDQPVRRTIYWVSCSQCLGDLSQLKSFHRENFIQIHPRCWELPCIQTDRDADHRTVTFIAGETSERLVSSH